MCLGRRKKPSAMVPTVVTLQRRGPGPECHRQLWKQDREKLLLLDRKPITGFPKCTCISFQKLDQDSCFLKKTGQLDINGAALERVGDADRCQCALQTCLLNYLRNFPINLGNMEHFAFER